MNTKNPAGFKTYRKVIATAGTPERVIPYISATTIAFVEGGASADTITDSDSNFINKGFFPGMKITVTGAATAGNNNDYTVDSVAADTLTLSTNDDVTDESATATIVIQPKGGVLPVARGEKVVLKAKAGNTTNIVIGDSTTTADKDNSFGFTLQPNESVALSLDSISRAYFDAYTNSEGIEVIFEV